MLHHDYNYRRSLARLGERAHKNSNLCCKPSFEVGVNFLLSDKFVFGVPWKFSTNNNFQKTLDHLLFEEIVSVASRRTKPPRLKVEGFMVSKCANPACSTPFHYLREGKVFRVEVEVPPPLASENTLKFPNGNKIAFRVAKRKPGRKLEHFWLCGTCSQTMSLLFDKDNGVTVLPKPRARALAAAAS